MIRILHILYTMYYVGIKSRTRERFKWIMTKTGDNRNGIIQEYPRTKRTPESGSLDAKSSTFTSCSWYCTHDTHPPAAQLSSPSVVPVALHNYNPRDFHFAGNECGRADSTACLDSGCSFYSCFWFCGRHSGVTTMTTTTRTTTSTLLAGVTAMASSGCYNPTLRWNSRK